MRSILYTHDGHYFVNPRYKDVDARYYDTALHDFIQNESHSYTCVAQYNPSHSPAYLFQYDFPHIFTQFPFPSRALPHDVFKQIHDALQSVGLQGIPESFLNSIYHSFLKEKRYYSNYLKFKRPKYVIFNRAGLKKGLIAACHQLHIPIFETQHGMYSKSHLAYSYPCYDNLENKVCAPNLMFTFAD